MLLLKHVQNEDMLKQERELKIEGEGGADVGDDRALKGQESVPGELFVAFHLELIWAFLCLRDQERASESVAYRSVRAAVCNLFLFHLNSISCHPVTRHSIMRPSPQSPGVCLFVCLSVSVHLCM